MLSHRNLIVTLQRHVMPPASRPFAVDLGLAAGFFGAWLALCGFDPLVAAASGELRLAVRTGPYRPQWPSLGPTLIGLAGLVLAWIRHRFQDGGTDLQDRLQRATLLAGALLALRLFALVDPIVRIFPYLTILWSPHSLWALALVFLGYMHLPALGSWKPLRTAYVAGALFALCLPLYVFYTLYFCQVTMLHSDEGQYLRVTQSLVHDGDMDLANNLNSKHVREFHVVDFSINKAPASPEGKVHSKHPIGLSVALVPAYRWGLEAWANPRLSTALFIALLASLCVPLIFIYLTRLGAESWSALTATAITAITGPYFYYSNQIYPEIPAIAIVLATLIALAHWQTPGGTYQSLGRWEIPVLGLLTLLLCCLPFLHPRLVPMGLFCGVIVLLQAWRSRRRWWALSTTGLVVACGLWSLIAFHYAFSGDWLGPLRPGSGAWDENALDIAIWKISLPGHWLHAGRGILNTSPIYFFALFGLLTLARLRDRRILVALVMFAATAGINGLHTLWVFGHDLPSRFLMTALPVLAMGLAWGLPPLLRRATTSFFFALALAISLESVLHTLVLPELGYRGYNLLGRSINGFYPLHLHFFESDQRSLPLVDLVFWGLLTGALYFRPRHSLLRTALLVAALFTPFLWGQTDTLASRLESNRSPYMHLLGPKTSQMQYEFNVRLKPVGEKALDPEGRLRARAGHTPPGWVLYSRMSVPLLNALYPGIYRLRFRGLSVEAPDGRVSGYLTLSRHYTVPSVSSWSTVTHYPLEGGKVDGDQTLSFLIDRPRLFSIFSLYTGLGDMALDAIRATFLPVHTLPEPQITEIGRIVPETSPNPVEFLGQIDNLPKGYYQIHFKLSGSTFTRFFERNPAPIRITVSTHPHQGLPHTQSTHPPWWLSIPFARDEARQLRFKLDQTEDVQITLKYDGKADLDVTEFIVYRETFGRR
ncbi:MAG: hypothetical protein OYM47_08215 [Gemmatimonadota bacterium]|nr:hypothetical protein [Gemmatimonadota bacterium]